MIRLTYIDDGTEHNDVILTYAGEHLRCDSYYFFCDPTCDDKEDTPPQVRRVIHFLLKQWHQLVSELEDRNATYLPFDFSDQCTGWVRCRKEGEFTQLDWGWSLVEGWSFPPSDIREAANNLSDFKCDASSAPHRMYTADLLQCINENMMEFANDN
jgi:hypothetical protein